MLGFPRACAHVRLRAFAAMRPPSGLARVAVQGWWQAEVEGRETRLVQSGAGGEKGYEGAVWVE